jgi:hypothetical protein
MTCPALRYFSKLSHKRHDLKSYRYCVFFKFLYEFSLKHFSFQEEMGEIWPKPILVFILSTRYCHILIKLEFYPQIFEKHSNIKFHENPSSGSREVPCGHTDGQTYMTKLTVALRNFAHTPADNYRPTAQIPIPRHKDARAGRYNSTHS